MDCTPFCPTCDINLVADDFYDCNSYENPLRNVEFWYGFCPNCRKNYTWKRVFIFSHFDEIKEDT